MMPRQIHIPFLTHPSSPSRFITNHHNTLPNVTSRLTQIPPTPKIIKIELEPLLPYKQMIAGVKLFQNAMAIDASEVTINVLY